jgi:hypothetical protein
VDTKTGICGAIKANGERCTARAIDGAEWCYNHHPDCANERKRNASKGGKSGGRERAYPATRELTRLAERLERTADQVISEDMDRSKAVIVGQLLNGARAAWVASVKVKEAERLEEELEELKRIVYGERYPYSEGDYDD